MDKKITYISRDIKGGKYLEENIPKLLNHMANQYDNYAKVRLVMHYYAFYEAYCDDEHIWSIDSKEILSQINHIIQKNILNKQNGKDLEKIVQQVDELRNAIMKRMSLLSAYTDIFQIYEYILNRVEYRFKEEIIEVDDEEFAKDMLRYIFDTQDNMIINEKIKDIIGQLPIRMTKQKYFNLLRDSLRLYLGADSSSLDTYLYLLRTSAMLYPKDDGMESYYPKLWEQKTYLTQLKYKEIVLSEFEQAEYVLKQATSFLETEFSVYYSLQEIVNEVYAILLCTPYAGMDIAETENQEQIIASILQPINNAFLNNEKNEIILELMDKFTEIEGVQEELSYDLTILEDALYEVEINHRELAKSMMLEKLLNVLLSAKDLLSYSLFIDLNEKNENITVSEERLLSEADHLENELTALFEKQDRTINRAVMANTLNKIPVFFKDHKEVMDYIRYSLECCTDPYEKMACIEIITDIMSE